LSRPTSRGVTTDICVDVIGLHCGWRLQWPSTGVDVINSCAATGVIITSCKVVEQNGSNVPFVVDRPAEVCCLERRARASLNADLVARRLIQLHQYDTSDDISILCYAVLAVERNASVTKTPRIQFDFAVIAPARTDQTSSRCQARTDRGASSPGGASGCSCGRSSSGSWDSGSIS